MRTYVDLTLESDIHFLRFPAAIRPAGQLNNGLFLLHFQVNSCAQLCVRVRACVHVRLNRAGPLQHAQLHNRRSTAQWLVSKDSFYGRRCTGRGMEEETSTRCAHLLGRENCGLTFSPFTCCSSLSLSVSSNKVKSSQCAET